VNRNELANNKKKLYSLHKKDLYLLTVKLYSMENMIVSLSYFIYLTISIFLLALKTKRIKSID